MPENERPRVPLPPLAAVDQYEEAAQRVLPHVRLMHRFFGDVVDVEPFREHYDALYGAYMDILSEEITPYALMLALAVMQLEDAYPEIKRPEKPEPGTLGG